MSDAQDLDPAQQRYLAVTPKSRALFERAQRSLPGGVSRAGMPYSLHPVFIERARGQFLYDVDGREILDLSNGHSALPLGHAHPAVVAAVQAQAERGLGYALMEPGEVRLAEMICARVPSIEQVRFTASGTEATMFAIRLARAYTGRLRFARMEGSYHGMHDMMGCGLATNIGGTWRVDNGEPVSSGVPPTVRDQVLFLPFNDLAGCEARLAAHHQDLAALIVEPMLGGGGAIPAEPGFLAGLRALCDRFGVLLVFDEMITIGLAPGGGQELFGVRPDLTTSGKLLGGGLPMGCFGGRADVMALLDGRDGEPRVFHTGTWNGHPMAMAAGIAQLHALTPDRYDYLRELGDYMRQHVRRLAADRGVALQVTGLHQFSAFHYAAAPVRNFRDAQRGDRAAAKRVALSLLGQGFYTVAGRTNLSTAVTFQDTDRFVAALDVAFAESGLC